MAYYSYPSAELCILHPKPKSNLEPGNQMLLSRFALVWIPRANSSGTITHIVFLGTANGQRFNPAKVNELLVWVWVVCACMSHEY